MSLERKLVSGTVWSFLGSVSVMGVTLVTNLILARLLTPSEFGQFGVVLFFIVLGSVLSGGGFAGALIRKEEVTKEDYSTAFVFNFTVSVAYFILIYLISPWISNFYDDPELKNILPALTISVVINALHHVNIASLTREMKFKKKTTIHFCAVVVASVIGIIMAFRGYGVWSLVVIQIITSILLTLILWIWDGFLISFIFKRDSFRQLYAFGANTTVTSLITTGFDNLYSLIIAKYFTMGQVGFFYQAKKLQDAPVGILNAIAQGVVFSSLSKVQKDMHQFFSIFYKIIVVVTVIMGFFVMIAFTFSEEIIQILFGERWIPAHQYLRLLVIASFFFIQEQFNRVIFKVYDKTRYLVWLEVIKKSIQIGTIVIGVYYESILILLYGLILTSVISYLINLVVSRKVIKVSFVKELYVTAKVLVISVLTILFCLWLGDILGLSGLENLYLSLPSVLLYIGLIKVFRMDHILKETFRILKSMKR